MNAKYKKGPRAQVGWCKPDCNPHCSPVPGETLVCSEWNVVWGVWGYYRLLPIKDLTLNSQRIHGQIPVSDRSLTHLYSARLGRTRSLHPSLSQLKSIILSLSSAPPPLCVLPWFPGHHLHAALCLSVRQWVPWTPQLSTLFSHRQKRRSLWLIWAQNVRVLSLTQMVKITPNQWKWRTVEKNRKKTHVE